MTLPLLLQTPAEALADSLHGLDQRIAAPLDEVPALRRAWADSLIERLEARGYAIVPVADVAPSGVGEGHPSVGEECPACHQPFQIGDYTSLVMLGPGDDEEARERARAGRPYNAIALEVHWDCASEEARRPADVRLMPADPRIVREGQPGFEKATEVPSNLGGTD